MDSKTPPEPKHSLQYALSWEDLLESKEFQKQLCGDVLQDYILQQRWYGGKASKLKYLEVLDYFSVQNESDLYYGLVVEANYIEAFVQDYFLPLGLVKNPDAVDGKVIAKIKLKEEDFWLVDATLLESFRKLIFEKITEGNKTQHPYLEYRRGRKCLDDHYVSSRFLGVEQSNTSIIYNDKYILKFFRRLYVNHNPDYELSKYLTNKGHFSNTPGYAGSITLKFSDKNVMTIALMQEVIPNEGDAWEYFSKVIRKGIQAFNASKIDISKIDKLKPLQQLHVDQVDTKLTKLFGKAFFEDIRTLAHRTAEMHVSLGTERINAEFTPSAYSYDYTVWLKNRLVYMLDNRINLLENNFHKLEGLALDLAQKLLSNKKEVKKRFLDFDESKLKGERIRVHGDYHLGQVLVNERDFYVIDFEGEPESTIRDRKVKQAPLKDVAGMFRSFNYAIYASIFNHQDEHKRSIEEHFEFAELVYDQMVGVFLYTYIDYVQSHNLNIGYRKEIEFLLHYSLLEKAIYELGYELNSRPLWAIIPLKGISSILNPEQYE
jgi:maltose alpha-D-glucosyltransferase/alpha-amylase